MFDLPWTVSTAILALLTPAVIAASPAPPPTLYLAGDSTCNPGNASKSIQGWGDHIGAYFTPAKLSVINLAHPGASTRSYIADGYWDNLLKILVPNDLVILQFGHCDSRSPKAPQNTGVIPSIIGESYVDVPRPEGKPERVYTFGHYLRQMIDDVRAKEAVPVVVGRTLVKSFDSRGTVSRTDEWVDMALAVAAQKSTIFLDTHGITADFYDKLGKASASDLYAANSIIDTKLKGADINAQAVVMSFNCIKLNATISSLSKAGQRLPQADNCWRSTGNANATASTRKEGKKRKKRSTIEL
ncbi:hypothetical protein HDU87_002006 [Geranomyces variabilis]|uniref:SGNH hydrolase-type esterase domain-containing protein n=1 Tax=Geranomyces variabilis TaxID=109894 RepID=A0AAD5TME1_9FUNG|nr:hypothetical protein HDU87_002006 [Geranomyces variabilis]